MKKIIKELFSSISIGITIGLVSSMIFSYIYHTSYLYPSSPSFIGHFSSTLDATIASMTLWGLMGVLFYTANFLFKSDKLSITKQTFYHFLITYTGYTFLAILAGWFTLNLLWLIVYTIIYLIIYLIIWLVSMHAARVLVDKINTLT